MNREDILRMAKVAERYAGEFCNCIGDTEQHHWFDAYNERFAELVAAAEREACAKDCETLLPSQRIYDRRFYDAVGECVKAIRARGEA